MSPCRMGIKRAPSFPSFASLVSRDGAGERGTLEEERIIGLVRKLDIDNPVRPYRLY